MVRGWCLTTHELDQGCGSLCNSKCQAFPPAETGECDNPWIDGSQPVKKVTLRGAHAGRPAFELKPRIDKVHFYIKVTLCDIGETDETMLLISAHPDH